jgi:hypothetical protein
LEDSTLQTVPYIANIDPTEVLTQADLDNDSGLHLGVHGIGRNGNVYVLSETAEDLARGHLLVTKIRGAEDAVTLNAAKTGVSLATIVNSTFAAGKLIGNIAFFDDDANDIGQGDYIKSHSAMVVGSAMSITLANALAAIGEEAYEAPGASLDVSFWDYNYVEMSAVTSKLQPVIGIAPVAVDQSVAPYFWRQKTGMALVIIDTAAGTAGHVLTAGGAKEGYALTAAADANNACTPFGAILAVSPNAGGETYVVAVINCY